MLAQKTITQFPRNTSDATLTPISILVTFYRDVVPPVDDVAFRYSKTTIGIITLSFDKESLPYVEYPLCYQCLVACMSDKPNAVNVLTVSRGEGGGPQDRLDDPKSLLALLLSDLQSFPRGWKAV